MNYKLFSFSALVSVLSWYCFALFDFIVLLMLTNFLPTEGDYTKNLVGFLVFCAGYACRPIGAIIWGHIGDKFGRIVVLSSSLYLLGFATLLMGFLPTYSLIVFWSTALFLILRITQGLASGGEVRGTLLFGLEHTLKKK